MRVFLSCSALTAAAGERVANVLSVGPRYRLQLRCELVVVGDRRGGSRERRGCCAGCGPRGAGALSSTSTVNTLYFFPSLPSYPQYVIRTKFPGWIWFPMKAGAS